MTFFVYKLRVVGTGFFYFGVTTDLEKRRKRHFGAIKSFVRGLIVIPSRNRPVCTGYAAAANAFIKGRRSLNNKECLTEKSCAIKVLHECLNAREAKAIEDSYIKRHKNNPKCFNIEVASRYYQRPSTKTA